MSIKLSKEVMQGILWDSEDVLVNEIVGEARWAMDYHLVFKYEGKFYETSYRHGTGDEGERAWEYEDEIECFEVIPVEKVVTTVEYKRV